MSALPTSVAGGDTAHVSHHNVMHDIYNRSIIVHSVGNSGTSLTLTAGVAGNTKRVTLNGNCTFTLAGGTSGELTALLIVLTQDGTGSRTVTWPASVKWPAATAPVLSTAAASVDRVALETYDGGTTWYGDLVGRAYA